MTAVIVLGQHRGGTSLVAGMLDALGVRMGPPGAGPEWVGRHWSNPTGHFENPEFVALDIRLLDHDGVGIHERPAWHQVPARAERLRAEIVETVRRNQSGLWGWKDPWTVLTLEQFLPLVDDPRLVVVDRDPGAVADSLYRRDGTGREESRRVSALWAARIDSLLGQYSEVPRLRLSYEATVRDPQATARQLAAFLGIPAGDNVLQGVARLVQDTASIRRESRRMARTELATFPKWVGWLLVHDIQHPGRGAGRFLRNTWHELTETSRMALSAPPA